MISPKPGWVSKKIVEHGEQLLSKGGLAIVRDAAERGNLFPAGLAPLARSYARVEILCGLTSFEGKVSALSTVLQLFGGRAMRIVYLILVVAFVSLLLAFAIGNLATTTVSMFGWTLTAPLAAVIVGVYFLGMLTGGSVVSFMRHTLHKATVGSNRTPKGASPRS